MINRILASEQLKKYKTEIMIGVSLSENRKFNTFLLNLELYCICTFKGTLNWVFICTINVINIMGLGTPAIAD